MHSDDIASVAREQYGSDHASKVYGIHAINIGSIPLASSAAKVKRCQKAHRFTGDGCREGLAFDCKTCPVIPGQRHVLVSALSHVTASGLCSWLCLGLP